MLQLKISPIRIFLLLVLSFLLLTGLSGWRIVHELDWSILRYLHAVDSPALRYGLMPFVLLGSIEISIPCLLLFSLWHYGKGEANKAYLILAALLITMGIEHTLKQTLFYPVIPVSFKGRLPFIPVIGGIRMWSPSSFPSGHCLRSFLVFGIPFLWWPEGQVRGKGRVFFGVFILFYLSMQVIAMNFYGFHWTRDCLGGYHLAFLALYIMKRCSEHEL